MCWLRIDIVPVRKFFTPILKAQNISAKNKKLVDEDEV
jgi:hypothetical protein